MDTNKGMAAGCRTDTEPVEQKVWLYASVGCLEQREDMERYIEKRIERMKSQAEEQGFTVVGTSMDTSRRTPAMERPGVQEMLTAVRDGKVGAVMTPSLRHISRKIDDFFPVMTELRKRKVGLRARDSGALSFSACLMKRPQKKGGEER